VTVSRVAAAILATAFTAAALAGPAHATHTTAWKAPTEGATVSGVLQGDECEATSSSPLGVARVEFYVDGALHNTERNAPYNCWNLDSTRLTEGAHVLKARGITKGGAVSEHSIKVTVDNVPDEKPPPPPGPPEAGMVKYMRIMNSAFQSYVENPTEGQKQWMRDHYDRALVYSPYFDSRTAWFREGWVYHDAYAIYTDSSLAREHPEWILRDSDGKPLYIPWGCSGGTCPQYAGNFGNPDFRNHIIGEIKAKLDRAATGGGYKGIFVDDVNMEFKVSDGAGRFVNPVDARTGTQMTETNWRKYMTEHVELIRAQFPNKEIAHNPLWWDIAGSDGYGERAAKAADYLFFERGVNDAGIVDGSGKYGFETMMAQADRFNVIFGSEVRSPDEAGMEYGLASYFLVNDGDDATSNHTWRGTPDDWWSAGYDLELGAPLGPRYSWNGLLRRDFERGSALVNQPGTSTRTVTLPETYLDLAGNPRTGVMLVPASGTVLRKLEGNHRDGTPPASP
jgi:hypothetical protein